MHILNGQFHQMGMQPATINAPDPGGSSCRCLTCFKMDPYLCFGLGHHKLTDEPHPKAWPQGGAAGQGPKEVKQGQSPR